MNHLRPLVRPTLAVSAVALFALVSTAHADPKTWAPVNDCGACPRATESCLPNARRVPTVAGSAMRAEVRSAERVAAVRRAVPAPAPAPAHRTVAKSVVRKVTHPAPTLGTLMRISTGGLETS